MNYLRTTILLAGLTGLFMVVGYLIGGSGGAVIALILAAATNLFSYWNSDRLVLSMHNAQEVDARSAPDSYLSTLAATTAAPRTEVAIQPQSIEVIAVREHPTVHGFSPAGYRRAG